MLILLAKDLSDTKKIINMKALLRYQKEEIFQRLLNLTFEEYHLFWYTLTDGKTKKGNAQLLKSSNISKAKKILKSLEEKKNENENEINKYDEKGNLININSKKNKTIREIIEAADLRDKEIEKIDEEMFGDDSVISNSDESLSSSSSDLDEDIDNNSKIIDNKNKEKEEKEEKERKEKEEKERKEKILKQIMEEKDEIDIFN